MPNPTETAGKVLAEASKIPQDTYTEEVLTFLIFVIVTLAAIVYKQWKMNRSAKDDDFEKDYLELKEELGVLNHKFELKSEADDKKDSIYNQRINESAEKNLGMVNKAANKMTNQCATAMGELGNQGNEIDKLRRSINQIEYQHGQQSKDIDNMGGEFRRIWQAISDNQKETSEYGKQIAKMEGHVERMLPLIEKIYERMDEK